MSKVRQFNRSEDGPLQPLAIGTAIAFTQGTAVIRESLSGRSMLRITRTVKGETIFRVSGELAGENVAEIKAVIGAENKGTRIVLDLTDLRSVDGEAVTYLEEWEAGAIKLRNCASFIREWIRRQRGERLEKQERQSEKQRK